jgi:hypothetical protein
MDGPVGNYLPLPQIPHYLQETLAFPHPRDLAWGGMPSIWLLAQSAPTCRGNVHARTLMSTSMSVLMARAVRVVGVGAIDMCGECSKCALGTPPPVVAGERDDALFPTAS